MAVNKSTGLTETEEYLAVLCNRTFLSLWSYPNLYRSPGKELADLTVVFGHDILLFSDKNCTYPQGQKPEAAWQRWFRRAVAKSAQQLWGAERWLRQNPDRVFLDSECTELFPLPIDSRDANIHLILVAHGAASACRDFYGGGSGSMMIQSPVKGLEAHTLPFVIGDIEPAKTFIHVLDDTTLDIVMNALDTISDFVPYISKKEALLRSKKLIFATGEEDLLPFYLTKMKGGEHDFVFPRQI